MAGTKKIAVKKIIAFFVVFAVFMFINLNVHDKFDDTAFRASFDIFDRNIVQWAIFYWNHWSSRILCHGSALILMTSGKYAFAVVNAFMQASLIFILVDYAVGKNESIKNSLALLVVTLVSYLAFIPYEVRMEADLWQIATVIYLWGIVAALYCMRFFYKKVYGGTYSYKLEYVVAVFAAIYASNCEQAAPVVIAFGVITELYMKYVKKQKFTFFNWIIILITSAGFLFCLTAPGNAMRRQTEILSVMGYYPGTSVFERAFFGIIASISFITKYYASLMLVLTSVLFLTAYTDRTMHHVLKMTAAVPCVYFGVLNLFDWMKVNFPGQIIPFNLDYLLFDILPLSPQSVSYSPNQWFSTALALFIYILTGILIFSLLNEKDGLCMGLLYGAAFAVIAVIGFTVTGRVSGARTTFIPAVLLITVLLKMSANLIKEYVS